MLQAQQILQARYQLKQQLGKNPGRQTWLAQVVDTSPPEAVILKLLAFNPQIQWNEFKLFEREAQVLKQLNHPRIPGYRDYFSLDQQIGAGLYWFGLVQDYIPGASLRQLLDTGQRFTEAQVRSIATDILEILIYLHNLNPPVLHRDIKPSNLILGDNGQVYLVDFGAVQDAAAAEGITFTVVGTTGYTPLEQFWGRAVPASDLYALGATLIHLLTGTSPADLPQQDLQIQFRDRISLSSGLTRWIEVLTEPDLEHRFTSASEAMEALQTGRYPQTLVSIAFQPAGTQIQLQKSAHQLSIKIPRQKRSLPDILKLSGNLVLTVSSVPFVLLLVIFVLLGALLVKDNQFFFFLSFAILLGWSGIATSQELGKVQDKTEQALRNIFGHHYLYFDREYFVIEQQLFGSSYLRHVGELSDIKNVRQIPFHEITINTKKINYSFANELTESERSWLFQEIQDWLNRRE